MHKVISQNQAALLGWNLGDRQRTIIRACFFLGYGDIFIQELVANPMRSKEAEAIVQSAIELGMTENDEIQISTKQGNHIVWGRRRTEGGDHD